MMANAKKIIKKTGETVLFGLGVASKLAELGLSVAKVVISGTKSLEKQFTGTAEEPIADFLFQNAQAGAKTLSQTFFKYAKELFR